MQQDHYGYDQDWEEDAPPTQPRCQCGAFLPWRHTAEQRPMIGVTKYVWHCRKCGTDNALVTDIEIQASAPTDADDLPF